MATRIKFLVLLYPLLLWLAVQGRALADLTPMGETEMAAVNGSGLAFALEDFRYQGAPTSYLELVGGPPPSGSSFQRGDVRYYGLTMSGESGGNYWDDNSACSGASGVSGVLGCPMSLTSIPYFAPHDNPFVLRVFDRTGVAYSGSTGGWETGEQRTVLEFLAPSNLSPYRWSFWGEIQVDRGDAGNDGCPAGGNAAFCGLQSQTLIYGKPVAPDDPADVLADIGDESGQQANGYKGPVFRLFQNSANADDSIGLFYHSRLSGDFRFTVNQQPVGVEGQGQVPRFSTTEGVYFRNVAAYLPLGQLHYQSILLDDVQVSGSGTGNFTIELTRVPDDPDAYDDFYSLAGPNDNPDAGYVRTGRPDRYYETHGYSLWGVTGNTNDAGGSVAAKRDDTSDGIYFYHGDSAGTFTASAFRPDINFSCDTGDTGSGCAPGSNQSYSFGGLDSVNLGDARISGMAVQHLKITTCSAGTGSVC